MANLNQVVAAYREGASIRSLAERHSLSRAAVRRILDAAGVPRRPAGRPRLPVEAEDVAELVDAGVGWEEISTRLGIPLRVARARYDEIRSIRGEVRRRLWHQVLTDALQHGPAVPVLPTVAEHLGRPPTSNEAESARRAAHDLARRGEATTTHQPYLWDGKRRPLLVIGRPASSSTDRPTRPAAPRS